MEKLGQTAIDIIDELHTERLHYENEYIPLIDAAMKLRDLEEAQQKGNLVELPCKVGDLVLFTKSRFNVKPEKPILARIIRMVIDKGGITFHTVTEEKGLGRNFYESSIGKSVFLKYDEALKAMEAKNEL